MAATLFSGTVLAGATDTVSTTTLQARYATLAVVVSSAYAATAATTGVKLQVSASVDGTTFSDFADVATTTPTPSSGTAKTSAFFASLSSYVGATALQFKLVNLDGTNNATVVALLREVA